MRKLILIVGIMVFCLGNSYAEEIVFTGFPRVKNKSSEEATNNEKVTDKDAYKLVITKEKEDYFWFSRERKPLFLSKYVGPLGNINYYFVEPGGSGYIFIFQSPEGKIDYMENVRGTLFVITYWGGGEVPKL